MDSLSQKHSLSEQVIAALRADTGAAPDVRAAAIRIAQARGDNPYQLNREAWAVVQKPGGAADVYALALRKAETALRVDPDYGPLRTTLGAAQYRLGKYPEAAATLAKVDQMNKGVASDLAFLALAQHQLGQKEQARATLTRLRDVLKKPESVNDAAVQKLLREAEELFQDQPPPASRTAPTSPP